MNFVNLVYLACLTVCLVAPLPARADPCVEAAKTIVKKKPEPRRGFYLDAAGRSRDLKLGACDTKPCRLYYFTTAPGAKPPTLPEGFRFTDEYAGGAWHHAAAEACAGLTMIEAANDAPARAPDANRAAVNLRAAQLLEKKSASPEYLQALRDHADAQRRSVGTAHGLVEVAAEAAQILGQIVVDRASGEAYRLIKQKLETLLGCEKPADFKETCVVLVSLRVQDIAASRDALFSALVRDGLVYLGERAKGRPAWDFGPTLTAVVEPVWRNPQATVDNQKARALIDEILARARAGATTPAGQALLMAAIGFAKCEVLAGMSGSDSAAEVNAALSACDVGAIVDGLTPDDAIAGSQPADATANADFENAKPAARALAHAMLSAATILGDNRQADGRQRLLAALDALFAAGCMVEKNQSPPRLACDDPNTVSDVGSPAQALALAKPVFAAAVAGHGNAVIAAITRIIMVATKPEDQRSFAQKRAFLLLGGLLDYAATSTHEARTKILESLTRDMSDRTGREGDAIFSLGGSLRVAAGGRFAPGLKPAFYGPLSLVLGVGFDYLPQRGAGPGFHLEASAVDLGAYLAFDNAGVVQKPNLADALQPSLTVAMAWGRGLPFFLGVCAGFSPSVIVDPRAPRDRVSFSAGVVMGIYVPLVDFN